MAKRKNKKLSLSEGFLDGEEEIEQTTDTVPAGEEDAAEEVASEEETIEGPEEEVEPESDISDEPDEEGEGEGAEEEETGVESGEEAKEEDLQDTFATLTAAIQDLSAKIDKNFSFVKSPPIATS